MTITLKLSQSEAMDMLRFAKDCGFRGSDTNKIQKVLHRFVRFKMSEYDAEAGSNYMCEIGR